MTTLFSRAPRLRNHIPLLIGLLLCAPVLFFQAFRFNFPLGYAGMFTQMAEQIAKANFALPMTIPHYGPGGIPFVYPPLATYLFALAIKIGVPTWFYLRFAPPLLTLLALIPFYFLTLELLDSKIAALVSMLLFAVTSATFYTHAWSAGVVRAVALNLCLAGLYFYVVTLKQFSWRSFLLAGLCLGLLLTTHWLYIVFAAIIGISCVISNWKPARIPTSLGILAIALLIAAPWLGLIISRHGLASILVASSSHGNTAFLLSLQGGTGIFQFIGGNLQYVTSNWFLAFLVLAGFVLLIAKKKFQLPLAFVLVLILMGETFFYTVAIAVMMAGAVSAEVYRYVSEIKQQKRPVLNYLLIGLISLSILFYSADGISKIAQYQPEIDSYSLQMAKFVRGETDPNATYLYIGRINEAEWFPYLLDRTPVLALWGSEWKGDYDEQSNALIALRECQLKKDWACMEALQQQQNVSPDLLVGPNQRWLFIQIKDTHAWQTIYTDDEYMVWKKLK